MCSKCCALRRAVRGFLRGMLCRSKSTGKTMCSIAGTKWRPATKPPAITSYDSLGSKVLQWRVKFRDPGNVPSFLAPELMPFAPITQLHVA